MLFKSAEAQLKLEVHQYEFPANGGDPGSDDRNWLVLRGTYTDEDGMVIKDSNSCLLTYELREMTAGLKVLRSGIRGRYESDFVEPYFELVAWAEGSDSFVVEVAFALPNTMEDVDAAEIHCTMTGQEFAALVDALDRCCTKFPDRA